MISPLRETKICLPKEILLNDALEAACQDFYSTSPLEKKFP